MNDQSNPWTRHGGEDKYDCPLFVARKDKVTHRSGRSHPYSHIRVKQFGVVVAPIDGDGHVVLIGQYRYLFDRYAWELPRGGGPLNMPPIESAKNELSEETGFTADHWLEIFRLQASPGLMDEVFPCFVAWGLHSGDPHPDPGEAITQKRIPFAQAVAMALSGQIIDAGSVVLILALQAQLNLGMLPPGLDTILRRGPSNSSSSERSTRRSPSA